LFVLRRWAIRKIQNKTNKKQTNKSGQKRSTNENKSGDSDKKKKEKMEAIEKRTQ